MSLIAAYALFRRILELTDAPVQFGLINKDHWYQPDWIDEERATAARNQMIKDQVIYGGASIWHDPTFALAHVVVFR